MKNLSSKHVLDNALATFQKQKRKITHFFYKYLELRPDVERFKYLNQKTNRYPVFMFVYGPAKISGLLRGVGFRETRFYVLAYCLVKIKLI